MSKDAAARHDPLDPPPTTSLVATADEMMKKDLECLFWHGDHPDADAAMAEAFENLATRYFMANGGLMKDRETICIDYHALRLMLGRFCREVYGIGRFHKVVAQLEKDKGISEENAKMLLDEVARLGVRVNSPKPFMTRRAAAFSLWMCTFRPVHLDFKLSKHDARASMFAAGLNYFIASSYLNLTGTVDLGKGDERKMRLRRILHDFTYREVNLSSLEFFYSGIYRKRDNGQAEIDGPAYGVHGDFPIR